MMTIYHESYVAETENKTISIMQISGGNSEEFFKDAILVFCRNANAGITYRKMQALRCGFDVDLNPRFTFAVFQSIVQEVEYHTYQVKLVAFKRAFARCIQSNLCLVLFKLKS